MRYNLTVRKGTDVWSHPNLDGAVGVLSTLNDHDLGPAVGAALLADLLDTGFIARPRFALTCEAVAVHLPAETRALDRIVRTLANEPHWSADTVADVVRVIEDVRPEVYLRIEDARHARREAEDERQRTITEAVKRLGASEAMRRAQLLPFDEDTPVGARVMAAPHTDAFMQGDRYGEVVGFGKTKPTVRVRLDVSGRVLSFALADLFVVPDVSTGKAQ